MFGLGSNPADPQACRRSHAPDLPAPPAIAATTPASSSTSTARLAVQIEWVTV